MTILLVFSFVSCDNTGNGNSSGESVATSEEKKKFEETYGNWEVRLSNSRHSTRVLEPSG